MNPRPLRRNQRIRLLPAASQGNAVDKWIQRAANITQPALLALGIFGYFYTVVPVFQNQQLQEQTAKLELEKTQAQRQLDSLTSQKNIVRDEILNLEKNWKREKARNSELTAQAINAKQSEAAALKDAGKAQLILDSRLKTLDAARWEMVLLNLSFAANFPKLNRTIKRVNQRIDNTSGQFILDFEKNWPQPYEELLDAVRQIEKKKVGNEQVPQEYYAELRDFIEENRSKLVCSVPDFKAMHTAFLAEFAEIQKTAESDMIAEIADRQKEYDSRGERVLFTKEYKESTKKMIVIAKNIKLETKYSDQVSMISDACDDRARMLIKELIKIKNAE